MRQVWTAEVKQWERLPNVLGKVAKRRCGKKDLSPIELFGISTDSRQPLGSVLTTDSTE